MFSTVYKRSGKKYVERSEVLLSFSVSLYNKIVGRTVGNARITALYGMFKLHSFNYLLKITVSDKITPVFYVGVD